MLQNKVPEDIIDLLNEKADQYNSEEFIAEDPIQVPHQFGNKENIEIAGFLTAAISWGQRGTIIKNALDLIRRMDNDPVDFLFHSTEADLSVFNGFVHRTFQAEDCKYFIKSLKNIYLNKSGLRGIFENEYRRTKNIRSALAGFRHIFFEIPHPERTEKHIADVLANASCKRLNMFLRWMVRKDDRGVDFGIWEDIDPADLYIPLDIHTGTVARKLGLLNRRQDDWKAVEELTSVLRRIDPGDPIRYDFALFGLGLYEHGAER